LKRLFIVCLHHASCPFALYGQNEQGMTGTKNLAQKKNTKNWHKKLAQKNWHKKTGTKKTGTKNKKLAQKKTV